MAMAKVDPEQLIEWYEQCGPELHLYALQWHGVQVAEDLVQDAFFKLLSLRQCPEQVKPWLFSVVRNSAISRLRQIRSRNLADEQFPRAQGCWLESTTAERLDAKQAQAILETLPTERREIVIMRIWGQLSFREIAEIVQKSVPWVHREYKAALGMIKCRLESPSCRTKQA